VSKGLIIFVGLIYAYIAAESLWNGNKSMAIVFGGYAFSNVGLWLLA
jgi:hypothetical protein